MIDPEFINYIDTFKENVTPKVDKILENFQGNIIKINNYIELEDFYNSIRIYMQLD